MSSALLALPCAGVWRDAACRAACELRAQAAWLAVVALAAFAGKAFYARADAEALRFVLAPTAALVTFFSGHAFEAERGVGYLSREAVYVIAPACAGLNYTIIAFATLALGFAPRIAAGVRRAVWLLAAAGLAYAASVLVNAARIALALELRAAPLPAWLSAAQAHRLAGVVVYLGSLWALSALVERGFARRAGAWRAALLPLAAYLGVTLLLPLANGAWRSGSFWEHARLVLAASFALTSAALAVSSALRSYSPRSRA